MASRYKGIEEWKKSVLGQEKYNNHCSKSKIIKVDEKYFGIGKNALKDSKGDSINAIRDIFKTNYESKFWDILRKDKNCIEAAHNLIDLIDEALKNAGE